MVLSFSLKEESMDIKNLYRDWRDEIFVTFRAEIDFVWILLFNMLLFKW